MVMPAGTKAGDVYNGITAIRHHHDDSKGNQYWVFRCRCGRKWICRASLVRSKHTTSCGQGNCHPAIRHGECRSQSRQRKEYTAFYHMLLVCYDVNDQYYPEIGAKGIRVCTRWKNDFENFFTDVGSCPKGKHYLQRIDRSKDYKRGNVRWADALEMGCHQRSNRWITLDRITLHLNEWSRVTGIIAKTVARRLNAGWSVVEALTTTPGNPRGDYVPSWRKNRAKLIELARRNFQNRKSNTLKRRKSSPG